MYVQYIYQETVTPPKIYPTLHKSTLPSDLPIASHWGGVGRYQLPKSPTGNFLPSSNQMLPELGYAG